MSDRTIIRIGIVLIVFLFYLTTEDFDPLAKCEERHSNATCMHALYP